MYILSYLCKIPTLESFVCAAGLVVRVQAAHDIQVRGLVEVRAAVHAAEPDAAARGAAAARRVPAQLAAQARARRAAPDRHARR